MWDGEDLSASDEAHLTELEGLRLLIELWVIRDIRLHLLPRSISDAKNTLQEDRREQPRRAVDELAAAPRLDMWAEEPADGPEEFRPLSRGAALHT